MVNEYFSLYILHDTFINGYLQSCFTTNLKKKIGTLNCPLCYFYFKHKKQLFIVSHSSAIEFLMVLISLECNESDS